MGPCNLMSHLTLFLDIGWIHPTKIMFIGNTSFRAYSKHFCVLNWPRCKHSTKKKETSLIYSLIISMYLETSPIMIKKNVFIHIIPKSKHQLESEWTLNTLTQGWYNYPHIRTNKQWKGKKGMEKERKLICALLHTSARDDGHSQAMWVNFANYILIFI